MFLLESQESDGTENVLSGSLSFYTCNLIVQEVSLLFMIWLFRKRLYVIMFFNE